MYSTYAVISLWVLGPGAVCYAEAGRYWHLASNGMHMPRTRKRLRDSSSWALSDTATRLSYQYLADRGGWDAWPTGCGGLGPIAILGTHHRGGLQRICSANSCQQIPDSRHHTTAASTRFLLAHTIRFPSLRSPSAAHAPTTDRRLLPGPRLEQRWCVIDFSCLIPHANHPCLNRRVKPSRYRVRIHIVRGQEYQR